MIRFRWHSTLAVAVFLAGTPSLYAQRSSEDPHVGYVFPPGGRAGASFDVMIGGQFLREAADPDSGSRVIISGGGIKAKIVKWYRPMTRGEFIRLNQKVRFKREELEEEQQKKGKSQPITNEYLYKLVGITEDDLREMAIYRRREADPKRQPNVQIAEELTVRVDIDSSARLGDHELRVVTPTGMSNPLWFFVSQWPEVRETEPNDVKPDKAIPYGTLPVVVNGQVYPGDVDRFAFKASKGMHLVISAGARELMPYLADGVPGWFQAVLALYDSNGEEVAYAGAYHYRQDPVIYYEVPKDDEYVVQIHDSVFRGREDFVYRITIGEIPMVTGVFPLGGRAGADVDVELLGWNLKKTELSIKATPDRNRSVRWYSVPQSDKVSVQFPLRIDSGTEIREQEPNDSADTAQSVSLPIIINGRIDKPDDVDYFRFHSSGKFVAEVFARRFGSPLDSTLTVTDGSGKEFGFNDDYEDKSQPLLTHHADSRLLVTPPSGGACILRIADAQRKGGREFAYRLYIRPPHPDFQLRVVPSSIIAKPGGCVPITVHALRFEDHADDIGLALVKAPPGFKLDGAIVPGNQQKVQLTLTVPPVPTLDPLLLEMEGVSLSKTGGGRVSRYAVPAESMMQAFFYWHIVPTKDWTVFVHGDTAARVPLTFPPTYGARLQQGVPTPVFAMAIGNAGLENISVELNEPPEGLTIDKTTCEGKVLKVMVATDEKKVKAGLRGNLVFKAFREYTPAAKDNKAPPKAVRNPIGFLPALPFEVVGKAATPPRR